MKRSDIEIMAPVGSYESLAAAIRAGADAVYFGVGKLNMRSASAANFTLDVDAKDELKRALLEYKGSVLLICHEPEFYRDVVNEVWDCTKWTTKII